MRAKKPAKPSAISAAHKDGSDGSETPKQRTARVYAANRFHTYMKGWYHGAGRLGMDPLFTGHETLAPDYERGYSDAQVVAQGVARKAAKHYGYELSILRGR